MIDQADRDRGYILRPRYLSDPGNLAPWLAFLRARQWPHLIVCPSTYWKVTARACTVPGGRFRRDDCEWFRHRARAALATAPSPAPRLMVTPAECAALGLTEAAAVALADELMDRFRTGRREVPAEPAPQSFAARMAPSLIDRVRSKAPARSNVVQVDFAQHRRPVSLPEQAMRGRLRAADVRALDTLDAATDNKAEEAAREWFGGDAS